MNASTDPILPIAVDLDGTLIKTDLLVETASSFLLRRPLQLPRLAGWLAGSRAGLKARLAEATGLDATSLPYHPPLLEWLREQKAAGRRLVLATASHRSLAEQVAAHLELFDEVLATEGENNLKAAAKRDLLVQRYGVRGFEYVGNDWADLPVWEQAAVAHVVGRPGRLIEQVRAQGRLGRVFDDLRGSTLLALVRAMRPHQWLKNLLVFIPLFAAHRYGEQHSILAALLAFIAFSLTASSVYLLNDMVDVADDRHHKRKKTRPFASGNLGLLQGWLAWPGLLVVAGTLSLVTLPPLFGAVLGAYLVLTVAYSLRLKQSALVDVMTLATLYTMRIVAGAFAIGVPLSFWLLTFSMFLFLSLAFIKRFSELRTARDSGKASEPLRGRGYYPLDLDMVASLGAASGHIAVLVLALYIQDAHTAQLYHTPQLIWLACPLLLYWISRAWMIAHRGWMHDDPIVFALKDRTSWLVGAAFVGMFVLARLVK